MKFVLLVFLLFCKQTKEISYPEENYFYLDQNLLKLEDFDLAKKIILKIKKICDLEINQNIEIKFQNQEFFISSKLNLVNIPFQIYKNQNEFALSYNCCKTDICKYSKILKLEKDEIISEENINGNLVYFDSDHYKILDDSISGLVFLFNRKNELDFIFDNLSIKNLEFNSKRSLTILKDFEISLFKNKKNLELDSVYKKIILKENTKILILDEDEKFYFCFFKSDEKSIDNILSNFQENEEELLKKIQAIPFKSKSELKKILKEKYFQFGYIEKSIFE